MAKLLVVSRSMALALRLADVHEVIEHPVERLDDLRSTPDIDVIVLDVGEPSVAIHLHDTIRASGDLTPVLLVSGYQPAWSGLVGVNLPGVLVVPLPITRAALLDGIGRLTARARVAAIASVDEEPAGVQSEDVQPQDLQPDQIQPEQPQPDRPQVAVAETEEPTEVPDAAQASPVTKSKPAEPPVEPSVQQPAAPAALERRGTSPAREGFDWWANADSAETPEPPEYVYSPEPDDAEPLHAEPAYGHEPAYSREPAYGGRQIAEDATALPEVAEFVPQEFVPQEFVPQEFVPQEFVPQETRPQEPEPLDPAAALERRRALLGRPASSSRASALARRLGGRKYETSLGPGGTSAELVALGTATETPPALDLPFRLPAPPPPAPPHPAVAAPASPHRDPTPTGRGGRTRSTLKPGPAPQPPPPFPQTNQGLAGPAPLTGAAALSGATAEAGALRQIVRELTARAADLFGVADTAQVLADEVVERAEADASAVLVPDGAVWRLSGGVGLRPLERRIILDSTHWLIAEIALAGRALLVEDTDIVRPKLAGAPLAAWRHLLAVPVPEVRAAVILARGHEAGAFTDRDLAAVVGPVREAAALLASAMETRQLARLLAGLREAEGTTR